MTKLDLQKELLEKIKLGMKPSDLKKQRNINPQIPTPPLSPIIKPLDKKSQPQPKPKETSVPSVQGSKLKQLQEQVNFHATTANTYLINLQKTMAQLDQAELTIRELQEKNEKLSKTMQELEKQAKTPANKPLTKVTQTSQEPKEPKLYLFTCSICDQNKRSQLHLAKVNGLGIDPTKTQKICDYCIKRVDIIKEREEDFF